MKGKQMFKLNIIVMDDRPTCPRLMNPCFLANLSACPSSPPATRTANSFVYCVESADLSNVAADEMVIIIVSVTSGSNDIASADLNRSQSATGARHRRSAVCYWWRSYPLSSSSSCRHRRRNHHVGACECPNRRRVVSCPFCRGERRKLRPVTRFNQTLISGRDHTHTFTLYQPPQHVYII